MNTPIHYEPEELAWIIAHCQEFTVPEIAMELGLGKTIIYNIGTRYKLKFKEAQKKEKQKKYVRVKHFEADAPKEKIIRPKAEYSNHSAWGYAS